MDISSGIAEIESKEFHPLDKRDLRMRLTIYFLFWTVIIIAIASGNSFVLSELSEITIPETVYVLFFLVLFLFFFGLVNIYKVFANQGYILRSSDISFRTGWLQTRIISVPFGRVQHVETVQNFLDKMIHLGRLKIYTAGGSSSDLAIRGLPYDTALRMKEYILNQVVELTDGEEE